MTFCMGTAAPRHQCLIYEGPPSRHIPQVARALGEKLKQNRRCLYLNSRPMVAGMKSQLAADGIDVESEIAKASLVLSSNQSHLLGEWEFDVTRMIQTLERALDAALRDGYDGLWATGDMTWEFGPAKDLSKLLEYEWRLEEFIRGHPEMGGICQYHAETLPRDVLRQGMQPHHGIFVNETLSIINPHYLPPWSSSAPADTGNLDSFIDGLFERSSASEV
jgi:hypothetical protein